ncbi:MAG: class I SAM-dependent methyltransferase [Saprospiraceae bacterium]|nr:class I SAM-dependent methyltransferase [Saprospiraceae bacterium]
MVVSDDLQSYLDEHISGLDPYLKEVERSTYVNELQPHMVSGIHQGMFLSMLVALKKPKYVLEIGTFTGFAAIALSKNLSIEGKVVTLEKDSEMAEKARKNISASDFGTKIVQITGDAAIYLPQLLKEFVFEMAFIDADKTKNKDYYELLINAMPAQSLILIDNVLWKGRVVDQSINDTTTNSFRVLNEFIARDPRVDACILPIRDGIWMIQKK